MLFCQVVVFIERRVSLPILHQGRNKDCSREKSAQNKCEGQRQGGIRNGHLAAQTLMEKSL